MTVLVDKSILGPIAYLGPDLTAEEWAQRLDVPLTEVLKAFKILGTKPKMPRLYARNTRRQDSAEEVVRAVDRGAHNPRTIAESTGLHPGTIRGLLPLLEMNGVLQRAGRGKNIRWVRR
jgi:hypothetical protein